MLPNPDWNEIFLQGLVGLGLVGYNTVKTLVDRFDAKTLMDYAEFYPSLSLIENGEIINQCARVHVMDLASRRFYLLHGPQPRITECYSSGKSRHWKYRWTMQYPSQRLGELIIVNGIRRHKINGTSH